MFQKCWAHNILKLMSVKVAQHLLSTGRCAWGWSIPSLPASLQFLLLQSRIEDTDHKIQSRRGKGRTFFYKKTLRSIEAPFPWFFSAICPISTKSPSSGPVGGMFELALNIWRQFATCSPLPQSSICCHMWLTNCFVFGPRCLIWPFPFPLGHG